MKITLAEAIDQLRNDLREAIVEGEGQDLVFNPQNIELELAITFEGEVKASGGVKLLVFLDVSGEAKKSETSTHRVKLTLNVTDKQGNPIKVKSTRSPGGF
jgi:NTP-dependent ternary system trypsin peptidase co-occuring protein